MSSRVIARVATAMAVVLTAACSAGADGGSSASSGGSGQTEVVFGWVSDAGQNYDPQATVQPAAGAYLLPVFDTLLTVAADGSIGPGLATEWVLNDDETVLDLTLRDDVTFHDGTPFNAEAVKANIERGQNLPTSVLKTQLGVVSGVTVVDETHVQLALSGGVGTVVPLLGDRAGMMISPAAFENPDLPTHPVGTGPWQVSDDSVPGQEMIYTAFEDYWDPAVQGIETFVIRLVSADASIAGMSDGSLDLLLMTSNPQDTEQLEAAGDVVESTGLEYVHTIFLGKGGVFADEHARLALSYAIDRQLLADTVFVGQCDPTGQPFQRSSWAHDPNTPAPNQDGDRVREELQAANLPDGFEFNVVVSGTGTFLPGIAQAIQSMVSEYGIEMTVEPVPPAQLTPTYIEGRAQALYTTQSGGHDPSVAVSRVTSSLSPGGGPSPALVELAQKGADATDQGERESAYREWSSEYQAEAFHVSVCNQDVQYAHAPGVQVEGFNGPLGIDPRGITTDG